MRRSGPCGGRNVVAAMRGRRRIARLVAVALVPLTFVASGAGTHSSESFRMVLPVRRVGEPPRPYIEFCNKHPGDCDMVGARVIAHSRDLMQLLGRVNRNVNAAHRLTPDLESCGEEDSWDYPKGGMADCEDFAIEKRRRLVAQGLPRAAITLGIVRDRVSFCWHAVLLVETSHGTYILDNLAAEVVPWQRSRYDFEARERTDGKWDYFDQAIWSK